MSAKTQINKIKTLLGLEIKLEQMKLENGTVLEAEAFEAGAEIFIVNEEDRIAVPMGEYMLEDGKVLIIAEDGIIGEIKDAEEEAPAGRTARRHHAVGDPRHRPWSSGASGPAFHRPYSQSD